MSQPHRPLTASAALFALLLTLLWSGNAIAIKAGLADAPPLRLGWMRFVVGGVAVAVWAIATKADLRVKASDWRSLAILGALFSVQLAFMNIGLSLTTAGHGAVLTGTFPIWVAILAHFFVPGDRLTPLKLLGVLTAYGGIVLLFADSVGVSFDLLLGDLFAAISGFLLGVRQVYNARLVQTVHPAKLLLGQAAFGTVTFVVASLILEPDPYQWTLHLANSVLYQGVVIAGFGFIGNMWLLQRYFPSQVGVIALAQPIFSIVAARIILGEPLNSALWLSAMLVMVGAGLVRWPVGPRSDPTAPPTASGPANSATT